MKQLNTLPILDPKHEHQSKKIRCQGCPFAVTWKITQITYTQFSFSPNQLIITMTWETET